MPGEALPTNLVQLYLPPSGLSRYFRDFRHGEKRTGQGSSYAACFRLRLPLRSPGLPPSQEKDGPVPKAKVSPRRAMAELLCCWWKRELLMGATNHNRTCACGLVRNHTEDLIYGICNQRIVCSHLGPFQTDFSSGFAETNTRRPSGPFRHLPWNLEPFPFPHLIQYTLHMND